VTNDVTSWWSSRERSDSNESVTWSWISCEARMPDLQPSVFFWFTFLTFYYPFRKRVVLNIQYVASVSLIPCVLWHHLSSFVEWCVENADFFQPHCSCLVYIFRYEGESVNRSQMDIKLRTCDIGTWKNIYFSTYPPSTLIYLSHRFTKASKPAA
jgi:hypothetical protein